MDDEEKDELEEDTIPSKLPKKIIPDDLEDDEPVEDDELGIKEKDPLADDEDDSLDELAELEDGDDEPYDDRDEW